MKVFQTSLSAAVIILIVVIIRASTFNRLPKKTFVVLWNIVLYRLLIPFSIPLSLSKYSSFDSGDKVLDRTKNIIQIVPSTAIHHIVNPESVASGLTDGVSETPPTPTVALPFVRDPSVVVLIWLTVAIIMAIFFLVTHLRCLREYKTALPVTDCFSFQSYIMYPIKRNVQIKQLDTIAVPLTYGIWKPVILIPKMTGRTEGRRLKYIIVHELTHIKHFDVLKKWLLAAALCIHWFNPLVWLMYILANRDIELACDEAVVRAFGQASRSSYALALIDMEGAKAGLLPMCSGFNKRAIEERVISIMGTKEVTVFTRLLAFVLVLAVMFTFAVSLVEAKTESKAMELFRMALGDGIYKYADNINQVVEESAGVVTRDFSIRIENTIFTDYNVYAIMAVEGDLPEDFGISGRIIDPKDTPEIPRWEYMLYGTMEEIVCQDGVRYFFCRASITHVTAKPEDIDEEFIKAHASPDSDWLKYDSLKDCEGKVLEFTLNINGKKHVLSTAVARVFTRNIVFNPDTALYEGYNLDEIILTPFELKIKGNIINIGENTGNVGHGYVNDFDNEPADPPISVLIVLLDGQEIRLDYNGGGRLMYQDSTTNVGHKYYDDNSGKFHICWRFNRHEINLSQVAAVIVNGITYRVVVQ